MVDDDDDDDDDDDVLWFNVHLKAGWRFHNFIELVALIGLHVVLFSYK